MVIQIDWDAKVTERTHVENGPYGTYVNLDGTVVSSQGLPISVLVDGVRYWYPESHPESIRVGERLVRVWEAWRAG